MSAFPESGRSDVAKIVNMKGSFRPRLRQKRRPMASLPFQQKSGVFFDLTD